MFVNVIKRTLDIAQEREKMNIVPLKYLQEQFSELKESFEALQKREEEQRKAIQSLESNINETEREKLRQQTHDSKKVQVTRSQ